MVLHLASDKPLDEILDGLMAAGLPNLFIPSRDSFIEVDKIPMLGTGQIRLGRCQGDGG